MESTDDVYRLRAEVRELADELTRLRTWDGGGGGGGGRVAKTGLVKISAASAITGPGVGQATSYDYDANIPIAGSTITVKNPFKIDVPPNTTIVVTLCGATWVLTAMECG